MKYLLIGLFTFFLVGSLYIYYSAQHEMLEAVGLEFGAGGGGGSWTGTAPFIGGNGASGVVIVRYDMTAN